MNNPITTTTTSIDNRLVFVTVSRSKKMLSHKSTLKHTSKGMRIWIENSQFLNDSGFTAGSRYNMEATTDSFILTLNKDGKRKVSNSIRNNKPRPIIDLQGQFVSKVFNNSVDFVNAQYIGDGTIIIEEAK